MTPRRTDKETGKVNVSPKLRRQVARPGSEVPRSRLGHGRAPHTHRGILHVPTHTWACDTRASIPHSLLQARGAAPTPGSPPASRKARLIRFCAKDEVPVTLAQVVGVGRVPGDSRDQICNRR